MLVIACAGPALAWPTITDRNFSLDLSEGPVIGSSRMIAMGGTSVAINDGAVGMNANPAATAVRTATSRSEWDWDWNVDWLLPGGSDYDFNGELTPDEHSTVITGSILAQWREWGLGFSIQEHDVTVGSSTATTSLTVGHVELARTFLKEQLSIGLGLRTGSFALTEGMDTLFSLTGASFEAGGIWRPAGLNLRAGATIDLPVTGATPSSACDPMSCDGYILPDRVVVPWQMAAGIALQFARDAWNQKIQGNWRDIRQVIATADVVVTGKAGPDGIGVEEFVKMAAQPSGRGPTASVRLGVEVEAIPGWLRVRAGSYVEPSRFDDVGVRVHGTFGLEARLFSFNLWGPKRAKISLTGDVASRYSNAGISVGFWH
jgi:hypothetical protein